MGRACVNVSSGICGQRRPRSVWSGPSLSANIIIRYYRMFQWWAKTRMRLSMCKMIRIRTCCACSLVHFRLKGPSYCSCSKITGGRSKPQCRLHSVGHVRLAFAQSAKDLHWAHFGQPRMQIWLIQIKTLDKLCWYYAGWVESQFSAHVIKYVFSRCISI